MTNHKYNTERNIVWQNSDDTLTAVIQNHEKKRGMPNMKTVVEYYASITDFRIISFKVDPEHQL